MLSLFDVLHEVPLLLELMPAKSLAALVAVNRAHRQQIHNHVTQIAIPDHEHIQTLFRGGWPRLLFWQISDKLQTYPDGTHSRSYTGVGLHEMRRLTLCEGSMTAAGVVAQLHCVSWSTLQMCRIQSGGLSCAGINAFCTYTWPSLLQLDLSGHQLDAAAIAHLAAGCWPCLTTLNLRHTGLDHAALQQLGLGYWPAVTHLNVSGNSLSNGSVSLMAPSPEPPCKVTGWAAQLTSVTGWAAQLTSLDLSHGFLTSERSLTASVTEQLSKSCWPCLEHLSVRGIVSDLNAMSHLVCGRWPELSALDIGGPALGAPALQMLAQAPWRHLRYLRLTANLQDATVSEQFTAGREDDDQQLLRYMQQRDAQPCSILMRGQSSALALLKGPCFMHLPNRFAQWLDLHIYVERP